MVDMLAGALAPFFLVLLAWTLVRGLRTVNAAMNEWPWYWPKRWRNDD